MGSKIRVLSDHTINKIAAGEVIENPASVIKELVENSLDAGSTEICIEIKGGGRQMIRISDNGCGMNPDDALLCLERHATSKIREVEEIHSLTTMGFRGEAIPSIAAISKFTILTTPAGVQPETKGTLVMVEGGKILHSAEAARSQGTTIEVKSLFFNIPVRKKFQKSPAYDVNEILKVISTISLGHPDIAFQLISQGKTVLNCPCAPGETFEKKLENRVSSTLGPDFLSSIVYVEEKQADMKLQGFFGLPFQARPNRTGQYLFINRRPVFSPLVSYAIKEGYGTSLPSGRHPLYVIHLTVPGQLVDVNVHPQKKEVRIRQDHQLKDLIFKALDSALQFRNTGSSEWKDKSNSPTPVFDEDWIFQPRVEPLNYAYIETKTYQPQPLENPSPQKNPAFESTQTLFSKNTIIPPRILATISRYILLEGSSLMDTIRDRLGVSSKSGLFILDQKAAHERIIYERLEKQVVSNEKMVFQALLIPYTFDLMGDEAIILRENIDSFHQLGIQIQEFGQNTFIIDAIPDIFGNTDMQLLVSNLLGVLKDSGGQRAFTTEKNNRLILAATRSTTCHESRCTVEEAQNIVNQLFQCKNPYQCPQGKMTILHIPSEGLAKQFLKC